MAFTKTNKEANTKFALVYLMQKGWTAMQAAAIVGNLTAESYMNPKTPRGDEGTAMGLAQWRDERLTQFTKIIGRHCEVATLAQQLQFVDWELNNTHKKAGKLLKEAMDMRTAVHMIDKHYERSAGKHLDRRIKFAEEALRNYGPNTTVRALLLDERLDEEVKHSMDASDPPSQTQPGLNNEPVPSSGYTATKQKTVWDNIMQWMFNPDKKGE